MRVPGHSCSLTYSSQNSRPLRALFQYPVPEKWHTTPRYLHPPGLESPQSYHKQTFQPPLLFPSPNVLLQAQAVHSLCWPIPSLFPSFGSDPGAGRLWFCALAQGEAQMLLENSTLAEGSVDPARACPALGGCSKKFVSWGVRVGIKVLGGQHGWILPWVTNPAL